MRANKATAGDYLNLVSLSGGSERRRALRGGGGIEVFMTGLPLPRRNGKRWPPGFAAPTDLVRQARYPSEGDSPNTRELRAQLSRSVSMAKIPP